MTKRWQCIRLLLILLLVAGLPFGCCDDCDDSPSDPGEGETAPDTTIDSGPEGTVTSGDVTFTWSGTDPNDDPGDLVFSWILIPQEAEWNAYDNSTMVSYTGLEDGTYTFKVRARNTAGEEDSSPAERTFVVNTSGGGDTTPPETEITDGPDGTVNTTDVYFEWTGSDDTDTPDQLVFSWRIDSGSWSNYAGETSTSITGLADGTHTFEVRARDTAGNVDPSPASRTFDVDTSGGGDTTPPETVITGGPSGTIDYTDVSFAFTGSDDTDPTSALQYQHRLDGGAWTAWSGSTSAAYNGLADGAHLFEVRARDTSGNVDPSPATRSFTVDTGEPPDTTPPETVITSGPSGTIDYSDVDFTFTGSDDIDPPSMLVYQHRMDGGAWSAWSAATMASYTGLADGPHVFEVRAQDSSGNTDPTPASRSFTVEAGAAEDVEFDFPVTEATGNPGEYVVLEGDVINNTGASATFRFSATSTPADWDNAYCTPGICVQWQTVVDWVLDPGANFCSIDFSIPADAASGTVSTFVLRVELVSDPSVNAEQVATCTVN